jgi:hypothetical protein
MDNIQTATLDNTDKQLSDAGADNLLTENTELFTPEQKVNLGKIISATRKEAYKKGYQSAQLEKSAEQNNSLLSEEAVKQLVAQNVKENLNQVFNEHQINIQKQQAAIVANKFNQITSELKHDFTDLSDEEYADLVGVLTEHCELIQPLLNATRPKEILYDLAKNENKLRTLIDYKEKKMYGALQKNIKNFDNSVKKSEKLKNNYVAIDPITEPTSTLNTTNMSKNDYFNKIFKFS